MPTGSGGRIKTDHAGGFVPEGAWRLGNLTDDEREIILKGCAY